MTEKRELRQRVLRERENLQPSYLARSDAGIFTLLTQLPEYEAAETVFIYYSIGNEVDTRRIINESLSRGKRIALPVTLGSGVMEFRAADSMANLRPGRMDIPEPGENAPKVLPSAGDIMIVPGLAFDGSGARIGYGAGYYDRYLSNCNCPTVGLCREVFFLICLPVMDYDVRVGCVVTEKRITRPPKESRL